MAVFKKHSFWAVLTMTAVCTLVAGCQHTTHKASVLAASDQPNAAAQDNNSSSLPSSLPEYTKGLGYRMTWAKTESSFVTAPQEIKDQAMALCREKGFVRAFMRKISFDSHSAVGFFDCTGTSSN